MKMAWEFLELKKEILHRIRETSGMRTDRDLLDRLSGLQPLPS
jgi:NitT/TauT family transport system ATP-binding protein